MKQKPKITGKIIDIHPQIVGRDCNGNLVIQFVSVNRIALSNVEEKDVIEWIIDNGVKIYVNGEIVDDNGKFTIQNPKLSKQESISIDFKKEMIIDKNGILRYRDTKKSVFEN